ncbi:MAG: hypothetical protein FVQ85_12140 [Planctomycetes bacterium]|nr:hypothetical protein [Planctomycetota bacterium]
MKKIAKNSLGIICIILGFLALITPLTPGSWLILIGMEILGLKFLLKGRLFRWLKGKRKGRFEKSITTSGQKLRPEAFETGQLHEKREFA